ncbi:hypothetical protein AERO8C_20276 [Aeromonas veronii]|uniref:Uncharacterized protein n=1 Tax=Aeromonas veronii TaxID=654 RepID=A0A653L134_AERVE|nr:hypothetical protein AERO8C_20276 [Aeromonas veronii]
MPANSESPFLSFDDQPLAIKKARHQGDGLFHGIVPEHKAMRLQHLGDRLAQGIDIGAGNTGYADPA